MGGSRALTKIFDGMKNRVRKIIFYVVAIIGYSLLIRFCYTLLTYGKTAFGLYSTWQQSLYVVVVNVIPIILVTVCSLCIVFFITNRGCLIKNFLVKLVADIIITFIATIVTYYFLLGIYKYSKPTWNIDYAGILVIYIVTLLVTELLYYMRSTRVEMKKSEEAKLDALQYQFASMKAQFDPHFLFNSLNMLMELIHTEPVKAEKFTEALSQIYRYILQTHQRERVKLSEELKFLESYHHILDLRYNNSLHLDLCICDGEEASVMEREIVPFSLQIPLENVVSHNTVSERHPMKVTISLERECIVVSNEIFSRKNPHSNGLGLSYLVTQYQAHDRQIVIEKSDTVFTLKIPYL